MNKKVYVKESAENKKKIISEKKRKLKKAVVIVAGAFAALCILCAVLYAVDEMLKKTSTLSPEGIIESTQTNLTADGKTYIGYYTADYDADIFRDEEYLEKDRKIRYYDRNGSSYTLDDYDEDELDEGARFFKEYFAAVIGGNFEKYRTMFTGEYKAYPLGLEKNPETAKFPMQRIYDIDVRVLGKTDKNDKSVVYNGKNAVYGIYELTYRILKNDGEFRKDLSGKATKPVIIELVTTDPGTDKEKTLIKNYYYAKDGMKAA